MGGFLGKLLNPVKAMKKTIKLDPIGGKLLGGKKGAKAAAAKKTINNSTNSTGTAGNMSTRSPLSDREYLPVGPRRRTAALKNSTGSTDSTSSTSSSSGKGNTSVGIGPRLPSAPFNKSATTPGQRLMSSIASTKTRQIKR